MNTTRPGGRLPLAVLDTNVILDWLVFRNPGVGTLVQAVESGQVAWLMDDAIRSEIAHVLMRKPWQAHPFDEATFWRAVDRHALCEPTSPLCGVVHGMRCRDPDDQKFVDLALARGAQWLVSRDKAVLALARKGRLRGLTITTPERWVHAPIMGT